MKKRDISEWASIAEIVGTVAVVISLALVIVSIRQNTAAIQVSNESFQIDLQDQWLADMFHDPVVFEYWDKLANNEPMSISERGQVMSMIARIFNLWENAYVNFRAGNLSGEQWLRLHGANLEWTKRRVPKSVWQEMSGPNWDYEFHDLIENVYRED